MVTRVPSAVSALGNAIEKNWIGLTAFALFVLLCWLLARWTWIFVPRPSPTSAPITLDSAGAATVNWGDRIASAHLFGMPEADKPKVEQAQVVVPSTLNAKLKGVFAGLPPFPAFAIINYEGKDQAVKIGTEVTQGSGVILEKVEPKLVLLRRGTNVEKLEFESQGGGQQVAMAGRGVPNMPRPPSPAANQFRLNVQNLNQNTAAFSRGELNNALQDPNQLANLGRVGRSPSGGVAVENAPGGSLMEKLGLHQGDVVRAINGVPVNSEADLMRLYQHFGQAGQIRVDGERGGQPLQLNYNVQN